MCPARHCKLPGRRNYYLNNFSNIKGFISPTLVCVSYVNLPFPVELGYVWHSCQRTTQRYIVNRPWSTSPYTLKIRIFTPWSMSQTENVNLVVGFFPLKISHLPLRKHWSVFNSNWPVSPIESPLIENPRLGFLLFSLCQRIGPDVTVKRSSGMREGEDRIDPSGGRVSLGPFTPVPVLFG